MSAFFSLKKTCCFMAAAVVISYIVMRIHRAYLADIPIGAEAPWSELLFAVQTVLLVVEWISGLIAVGSCIFYRPPLTGVAGVFLKLLLIAAVTAISLFAVRVVAEFGGANAVLASRMKIFFI